MSKGYFYLATVYSKHRLGLDAAASEAAEFAAAFALAGVCVYSPIVNSHEIALEGGIDPLDLEFWLAFDGPFMDAARGLIVVKMEGWRESKGIQNEVSVFNAAGKPIHEWDPQTKVVRETYQ